MFLFDFSLSKLYASTLFSTLIARKHWNDLINRPSATTTNSETAISLTHIERGATPHSQFSRMSRNPQKSYSSHHGPHVEITTHVERSTSEMDHFNSDSSKAKIAWGSRGNSPTRSTYSTATNNPTPPVPLMVNGKFVGMQ